MVLYTIKLITRSSLFDSMPEKSTKLQLKDALTNADGSEIKDGQNETRSHEELSKLTLGERMSTLPVLTFGTALLGMINNKKNIDNVEQMATLQRLLVKIRNKLQTNKGEWDVEKGELLELKALFDKMDPKEIQVNLHGQMYCKIQDLLIKVVD